MNEKLKAFDEELYAKIHDDFQRNELRNDAIVLLEDWIAKALIMEGLLGLLRKNLVEINGLAITDEDQIEPTFVSKHDLYAEEPSVY